MTLPKKNEPLLVLVDGSAYLYRAYHALPALTNTRGEPTGAIYGVTRMLRRLLADYAPTHVGVVFDAPGKTFRHDLFVEYKANRTAMASELVAQIPALHAIVQALGLHLIVETGVEADDVIGTLAKQAEAAGMPVLIFTGDKDFAQLVTPQITLLDTMKEQRLDVHGVEEKFGVPPTLFVDYLTLIGDTIDNIPGVETVGPKTAVKWLKTYGSLDAILASAHQIKGKVGEKLREALPRLPLTRQLLTLRCDVPLPKTPAQLILQPPNEEALQTLFTDLDFDQWLTELPPGPRIATAYQTILTIPALEEWLARLKAAPQFALALTTLEADNYLDTQLVGIALALGPEEGVYIPLAHDDLSAPQQLPRETVLNALKPLLENPAQLKIGYHCKTLAHVLANYSIELKGAIFDVLLESYTLNSTANHELAALAQHHLHFKFNTFEQRAGQGKKQLAFNQWDIQQATDYATQTADVTWRLHHSLWPKLQAVPSLARLFSDIEMALVPVLVRMERYGVKIDSAKLYAQNVKLSDQLQILTQQAYELAGETFNLNSPKQVQTILFEKLQLLPSKKTAKGQQSTAEEVLDELKAQHPLPQIILAYRQLSKLKSTYLETLPKQIHPRTGRIHTSYQQAVTATGRLSSVAPNLQNIPIRTEEGRRIRQAFIAAEGYCLMTADYSQIELRIMAHLSGDANLVAAFQNGQDIHQFTAAEIFGIPPAEVTAEQRRGAKAVNFGLIYGMSAFGLAKQLGVAHDKAQSYLEAYFDRYPAVKTYMEQTRLQAKEHGFVETVLGRRLYLPELYASQHQRQQYAERAAINAPLQGTAADLMKRALVDVAAWIQKNQLDIKMIMQIHDELVLEVKNDPNLLAETTQTLRHIMSQVATLRVPLVVNVGIGENWDTAHG